MADYYKVVLVTVVSGIIKCPKPMALNEVYRFQIKRYLCGRWAAKAFEIEDRRNYFNLSINLLRWIFEFAAARTDQANLAIAPTPKRLLSSATLIDN